MNTLIHKFFDVINGFIYGLDRISFKDRCTFQNGDFQKSRSLHHRPKCYIIFKLME